VKRKRHWGGYRFVGGNLALDCVNTVGYRLTPDKRLEYLRTEGDLVEWARMAGLTGSSRHHIRLSEAVLLREALYRILAARLRGARARKSDTDLLNRCVRRARASWKLQSGESGWLWQWAGSGKISYPLARVAESAAELLTSGNLALLRQCGDEECGWLFLDRSQGRRRKWCSMQDCGNRAKVRRFFAKKARRRE
jgi:predicted RNA-binding Zn ribbon-like protein